MSFDLNIFGGVKSAWQSRNEPEQVRVLGMFFWRCLLIAAFIIVLCAFWVGYQELGAVSQAESFAPSSQNAPPPLSVTQLNATLDFYSAQQSQYQTLSGSPLPSVADPSK